MKERRKNIEDGMVADEEKLADLFAVYKCGKENVIEALRWSRRKRRELNDGYSSLAIREFNNRIHYIRHINEDDALKLYQEIIEKNRIM